MERTQPFLFRFKKECLSPRRITATNRYKYDDNLQMLVVIREGKLIPLVDSDDDDEPIVTKKADIEKGDDQKDSRKWH